MPNRRIINKAKFTVIIFAASILLLAGYGQSVVQSEHEQTDGQSDNDEWIDAMLNYRYDGSSVDQIHPLPSQLVKDPTIASALLLKKQQPQQHKQQFLRKPFISAAERPKMTAVKSSVISSRAGQRHSTAVVVPSLFANEKQQVLMMPSSLADTMNSNTDSNADSVNISDSEWVEHYNEMYDENAQSGRELIPSNAAKSLPGHESLTQPSLINVAESLTYSTHKRQRNGKQLSPTNTFAKTSRIKVITTKNQSEQPVNPHLAHFVKERGTYVLVNNGYVYTFYKRESRNMNKTTWNCEMENCKATVTVVKGDDGLNVVSEPYLYKNKGKSQEEPTDLHTHDRENRLANAPWVNNYISIMLNPGQCLATGSPRFVHEGYRYVQDKVRGNGRISFRCHLLQDKHHKCYTRAMLYQQIRGFPNNWFDVTKPHNHDPDDEEYEQPTGTTITAEGGSTKEANSVENVRPIGQPELNPFFKRPDVWQTLSAQWANGLFLARSEAGGTIPAKQMETLRDGDWLYDDILNAYLHLLTAHLDNVTYISTFLIALYMRDQHISNVFLRQIHMERSRWIFVPAHLAGNHWALLLLDIPRHTIFVLDSMGAGPVEPTTEWGESFFGEDGRQIFSKQEFIGRILNFFISDLYKQKGRRLLVQWKYQEVPLLPQQRNGNDCGVFLLAYARRLIQDGSSSMNFEAGQIPYFRRLICAELIGNAIVRGEENIAFAPADMDDITNMPRSAKSPVEAGIEELRNPGRIDQPARFVKHNGCYHLVNDGFVYTLKRRYSENMKETTWKCKEETCPALIEVEKQSKSGQMMVISLSYGHIDHELDDWWVNQPWVSDYDSVVLNPDALSGKYSQFMHEGYKYKKDNKNGGRVSVRCRRDHHFKTVPKCPARGVLYQLTSGFIYNWLDVSKPHNHGPEVGDKLPIAAEGG